MKRLTRNSLISLALAGAVLVCFLIGGILHVRSLRSQSEVQSATYLSDATAQRVDAVEQQVRGDLQVLRGVAVSLSEMDLADSRTIGTILHTINQTNTFVLMGLADTSGHIDFLDLDGTVHSGIDLSGHTFFQQALAGEDSVSETLQPAWSDAEYNFFAAPVYQDGQLAGVLCGAETGAVFHSLLETPVFQGEGYFAIIDKDGALMTPPTDPRPGVALGSSIFDFATFTAGEEAATHAALDSGEGGNHLSFTFADERQLVTIKPLSFNGWYVLSLVPESTIYGYYSQTAVGTTVIIIAAFLIFLVLLYFQFRTAARNQRDLEHLAYTDLLTGQRNYTKFLLDAKVLLAENPGTKYAVWSHDIKKFYAINDVFGRAVGDRVLQRVTAVFEADNEGGLFCRLAADNFAGIRPYREKQELCAWFDNFICALANREVIPENQMRIDDVMGVYCIEDFKEQLSVDEMVTRASVAKRAAKDEAGNSLVFFNDDMSEKLLWNTLLEASAEKALREGEIVFFFQPKVSIQHGYRISGAEALARWNHPKHGRIPPDEFIPLFEENGFVVEMDRTLFDRICGWYVANIQGRWPDIRLAINVSRKGLMRDDFLEYYTSVKEKYSIADNVLELEFTESVVFDNDELFQNTVTALRQRGFICSIDDFGSGYSSLNVLKNLPINVLKLDAAFFRNSVDPERERKVVAGFLGLARELGIRTVAEGVETLEQVEFLRETGCDIVQGYVFAKPMPKEEYLTLLEETGGVLTSRKAEN